MGTTARSSNVLAPGPVAIDAISGGLFAVPESTLWDRRDWLVNRHSEHKQRINEVTDIANGEWYVVWPDLSQTPEAPTVANLIEMGINHWASIMGAQLPSVRVPVSVTVDRAQGKRGARKRERRLRELWEMSNASELAALLGGDYAGTGIALLGVWANFEEEDPEKRHPYFVRYDPRHSYALKDDLGNVTELLVARKIAKGEVKRRLQLQYPDNPELWEMFDKVNDETVEEWFWYTAERFQHHIVDISKDGAKNQRGVTLVDRENELGFVPVWETVRPTFDGQRRGIFDQTMHILRTMHRLMHLTILSTEEQVFPAVAEWMVDNPEQFGPGQTLHYQSPDGRIDIIGPSSHFDVKDLISRLGDDARQQAILPQQLMGEPGASIASGRAITASQGALDARLALAHKQFEIMFSKASGFLLAMDEIYCPGEKQIHGDWRDNRKAESWNPERDVQGEWKAVATYGIGAGSDPANIEVRLAMHLRDRLVSRETARAQLAWLEDDSSEPVRIIREGLQDALIAGIQALASQGQIDPAVEGLDLLRDDDVEIETFIEKLVEFMKQPPPQPGGAEGGGSALQEAESLARGGIPGNAAQGPPAQGLPPLEQILGQDARFVT